MEEIYSYIDYRDFLKADFEANKNQKSFYSYRYIARKTGIDASYYVKVLNKQKHIGDSKINILADFINLSGRKREYFTTLISYNRTKNDKMAKELFNKLMSLKNSAGSKIHDYRYFAEWYTIPMRELLNNYDFDGDYKKLSKQFYPRISEAEAKKAIKTLTELNMLSPDENGFLRPVESLLTTGDQWQSMAVQKFQEQMIGHAKNALTIFPKEERDISCITISTSKACLESISER